MVIFMLKREKYLSIIRKFYDDDLIKVLIGIRRSGKSIILKQIIDELKENKIDDKHIIYINFEDVDYSDIVDYKDLNAYVKKKIMDEKKYYLLFDEVQLVSEWEKAINSFKATLNSSIFITGSNSKLLSGELATLLSGRYIKFLIAPFTFREVIDLKGITDRYDIETEFRDYMIWGGMPQRFELNSVEKVKLYLSDLYDTIVIRDIIRRYNVSNLSMFERVMEYLVTNPCQFFSPTNMLKEFEKNNINISSKTIYECLNYAESSLLMSKISAYDVRGKRILSRKDKYYLTDLGIGQIKNTNKKMQLGFYLENIVYNELLYRGYDVSVGNNNGKEIDFIATKYDEKMYFQVAYEIGDSDDIKLREFGAYSGIDDNYPKYVLSMDKFDLSQNGIIHKNIIDWLLDK